MKIIIVTGMSGAGRSSALRALEDLGVRCVDNLPPQLLGGLVEIASVEQGERRIAVGVDSRGMGEAESFLAELDALRRDGHDIELLFLEAPDETLLRRYSETRRRHPLGAIPGAIADERALLEPIRNVASVSLDTQHLRARELRQLVSDRFGGDNTLNLVLMSFGFKKGLPPEADLVFDVRGLDNPHWDPALRPLSGFHEDVARFVLDQPDAQKLAALFERHVQLQVEGARREGRLHLTVAIGCTGGQHRSVALTRELERRLRMHDSWGATGSETGSRTDARGSGEPGESVGVTMHVRHRDVDRSRDDG